MFIVREFDPLTIQCNKCSDGSMEVKLPALLENYDRPTDRRTDGLTGKMYYSITLYFSVYCTYYCACRFTPYRSSIHSRELAFLSQRCTITTSPPPFLGPTHPRLKSRSAGSLSIYINMDVCPYIYQWMHLV